MSHRQPPHSSSTPQHQGASSGSGRTARSGEGEEDVDARTQSRHGSVSLSSRQTSLPPQLARLTYDQHSNLPESQDDYNSSRLRSDSRNLAPLNIDPGDRNIGQTRERPQYSLPPISSYSGPSHTPRTSSARDETRLYARHADDSAPTSRIHSISPLENQPSPRAPSQGHRQSHSPYEYGTPEGSDNAQIASMSGSRSLSERRHNELSIQPPEYASNELRYSTVSRPHSALDSAYLSDLSTTSLSSSSVHSGPAASTSSGSSGWTASADLSTNLYDESFGISDSLSSASPFEQDQELDVDDSPLSYRLRVAMPVSIMRGGPGAFPLSSRGRGHGRDVSVQRQNQLQDESFSREREYDRDRGLQRGTGRFTESDRRGRRGSRDLSSGDVPPSTARPQDVSDDLFEFEYDEDAHSADRPRFRRSSRGQSARDPPVRRPGEYPSYTPEQESSSFRERASRSGA